MELLETIFAFIIVISVIVFVHEFGHYIVARICGVHIEEFSIGFGYKIFGKKDKNGTLWKFALIPMGGYVKMLGDKGVASASGNIENLSTEMKNKSFQEKNVWQRMAIVVAGPLFNYLFAMIIIAGFCFFYGVPESSRIIKDVEIGSPAYIAGLKPSDEITKINGKEIKNFKDIAEILMLNGEKEIDLNYSRNGVENHVKIIPKLYDVSDTKQPRIGIIAEITQIMKLGVIDSFMYSAWQVYNISAITLKAMAQIIMGDRSADELGGPIKIAKYSAMSLNLGYSSFIWFMAMLSINLGLINLLPVPMLDGGHLFFYMIEAISGRPIPKKIQEIFFKIGLVLLIMLFIFSMTNDLISIGIIK